MEMRGKGDPVQVVPFLIAPQTDLPMVGAFLPHLVQSLMKGTLTPYRVKFAYGIIFARANTARNKRDCDGKPKT